MGYSNNHIIYNSGMVLQTVDCRYENRKNIFVCVNLKQKSDFFVLSKNFYKTILYI